MNGDTDMPRDAPSELAVPTTPGTSAALAPPAGERATEPTSAKRGSSGTWVLVATILGSSMAFIDGTVVNVALPRLQIDLHASATEVQWVVEAYSLFLSALLLVGGSLGDRYGRGRIYTLGVALFALASIWCGLAPDSGQLILSRAIQGVGGALLVPGSLAIISASFSGGERGRAIGTWSAFTSITTVLGPVLGGWLVEHASWRWVFFINAPLAVAVLALVWLKVPESKDPEAMRARLDWPGALLVTLGLGALTYGLIDWGRVGLGNATVLASLAAGVIGLGLFVWVEARGTAPMVPLRLFRSRDFSGTNLLTLFLYGALGGALYFLPFNLIQVQGYSPTAAGASTLPFIILLFTLSRWSGGLVDKYGAKLPLTIGPIIVAAGYAWFALPSVGGSYWTTFFPGILLLGLGMAVVVAPLTTTVMNSVDVSRSGVASGVNNAVSRVAGLLAIAVLGIVMLGVFGPSLSGRLDSAGLSPAQRTAVEEQRVKLAAIEVPPGLSVDQRARVVDATQHAFVDGFRWVTLIAAGMALASGIVAGAMIGGKERKREARVPEEAPALQT